jgi:lactate dehydrogenase-like 2-hydroxyacid dehydrogenase
MTARPVLLQVGPLPDWDQSPLDAAYETLRLFEAPDRDAFLAARGLEVRAIATRGDLGASSDLIAACPKLELISVYGVGYDGVDLSLCRSRGIRVTNTPDVLTGDLAVAMMLCQRRNMVGAEAWVRSDAWAERGMFPLQHRAHGLRAGILGLGRIGFEVGRRLAGFDMEIAYSARAPKAHAPGWTFLPDPVDLARFSDVLFVTLSASAETRHIVDRAVLEAIGPAGLIVNVSRAANIDEEALITTLETGKLGAAALDVFESEPAVNPRLLALANVLAQPHHGSGTLETRRAMGQLMRDNLAAHFSGRQLLTPVL